MTTSPSSAGRGAGEGEPFGLYVHIPFCLHKCAYCDFYSFAGATGRDAQRALVDDLLSEWSLQMQSGRWDGHRILSVFFGGGTPSLLDPALIGQLLETASQTHPLDGCEITLETNPETVTLDRMRGFRAAGINRISFGVQSFDPALLQRLERMHDEHKPSEAFGIARAAGFDNLSLDLIFGHAGQTLEQWQSDIEKAEALRPDHISAYSLTLEPGSTWSRDRVAAGSVLADADTQARMMEWTHNRLASAGLSAYETSNFARPGHECRHNLLYWRRQSYLGLGPSAHSFLRREGHGMRWSNPANLRKYSANLRETSPWNFTRLSQREAWEEEWMCRLRLSEGVRRADLAAYPTEWQGEIESGLSRLGASREAWIKSGATGWRLTPEGRLLGDELLGRLLSNAA